MPLPHQPIAITRIAAIDPVKSRKFFGRALRVGWMKPLLQGRLGRVSLFAVLCAMTSGAFRAEAGEITIEYADNETKFAGLLTTTADPLNLFITSGTALQRGDIGGDGSISKSGSGTLILGGLGSYTGGTVINEGTLGVGFDDALSGSLLTINGGGIRAVYFPRVVSAPVALNGSFELGRLLTFTGPVTLGHDITITSTNPDSAVSAKSTFAGVISGNHSLTFDEGVNPTGTIVLAADNTYTGVTTLRSGTLQLGAGGTSGSVAGNIVTNGRLVFDRSDQSTYGGSISGSGSVTKQGAGTLILTGANTYTGGTFLEQGALGIGSGQAVLSTGTLTIRDGTLLAVGEARTLANEITLNGSLTLGRGMTLSGGITLDGHVALHAGSPEGAPGSAAILEGTIGGAHGMTLTDGGHPGGQFTFKGANTHTGVTTLQSGTLTLANSEALGQSTLRMEGGSVVFSGITSARLGGLAGDRAVVLENTATQAVTLTVDASGENSPYAGSLSGAGSLVKTGAGSLILSGQNTYTGGTVLKAGTLEIGNDMALSTGLLTLEGGSLRAAGGERTVGNAVRVTGDFTLGRMMNLAGAISLEADVTITSANPDPGEPSLSRLDGVISGAHHLTFDAEDHAEVIALTASNQYSGGTTLRGGLVRFSTAANFGSGAIGLNGGGLQWAEGTSFDISSRLDPLGPQGGRFDTNGNDVELATGLSGEGGLVKEGEGTLRLSGSNGWAGDTTIRQGMLYFASTSALPDFSRLSVVSTATAAFALYGTDGFTEADIVDLTGGEAFQGGAVLGLDVGTGTFTFASGLTDTHEGDDPLALRVLGSGILLLTGENRYSGGTTVEEGTLQIGQGGSGARLTGDVANDGTLDFNHADDWDFGGVISGTGMLVKRGSGVLTLLAESTYSGDSLLEAGTLGLGAENTLGTGVLTIRGGALSAIGGGHAISNAILAEGDFILGRSTALKGDLTLTRDITITSANSDVLEPYSESSLEGLISGDFRLTFDEGENPTGVIRLGYGENTYTGGTLIRAGLVSFASPQSFGTGRITLDGGGLRWIASRDGDDLSSRIDLAAGGGTLDVQIPTVQLGHSLSGTGDLTKTGPGALFFWGDQYYSGSTFVKTGQLAVVNGDLATPLIHLEGWSAVLSLERSTYAGAITGQGRLLVENEAVLTGNANHTGGTVLSWGTLQIGDGGTRGSIAGVIDNEGQLLFNRRDTWTFDGFIKGSGGVSLEGPGTVIFSDDQQYTGETQITRGTLIVNGSIDYRSETTVATSGTLGGSGSVGSLRVAEGGTLAPGDGIGTLSADATTWESGGAYVWEISSLTGTAGEQWDLLSVEGSLSLDGLSKENPFTLSILSLIPNGEEPFDFDAAATYAWTIVSTTDGITGFAADRVVVEVSALPGLSPNAFTFQSDGYQLTLVYTIPEPASGNLLLLGTGLGAVALAWRRPFRKTKRT